MSEYRLAVCEDEPAAREYVGALCGEILPEWGAAHTVTLFASTGELSARLDREPEAFDLLLLDIQMEGMTGMELAHVLRERGNQVSILFLTGCADYALEGYGVHPVHFLLKPVEREALAGALRLDWERSHRSRAVVLRSGGRTVSLPTADIRYIESINRSAVVHLTEGERSFPLTMSQMERLTPADAFARCHNSFLVNLAHVAEAGRAGVRLRDGEQLPVGRRYYQSFQTAFIRYLNQ